MKKLGCIIAIAVVVVVALAIVGWLGGTYNSFVTKSQAIDAQWGQQLSSLYLHRNMPKYILRFPNGHCAHHGIENCQQLPHASYQGHLLGLTNI